MNHPAYGKRRAVSAAATVLLENNPSSMTLEGTNTWIVQAPHAESCVVVDPGYHDLEHLELLLEAAPVEVILLTHHHPDHAEGAPWLAEQTGAPIRAYREDLCVNADPLAAGHVVNAAGLRIQVLSTPGHTDDSVSFRFEYDGRTHVLTGDTVLGRGTTVLTDLGDYLESLQALRELPHGSLGLPGHGPELMDLAATVREYSDHRQQRLDQVRAAQQQLGPDATARQIVEIVYANVDQSLWGPAEASVSAQLEYLRRSQ